MEPGTPMFLPLLLTDQQEYISLLLHLLPTHQVPGAAVAVVVVLQEVAEAAAVVLEADHPEVTKFFVDE